MHHCLLLQVLVCWGFKSISNLHIISYDHVELEVLRQAAGNGWIHTKYIRLKSSASYSRPPELNLASNSSLKDVLGLGVAPVPCSDSIMPPRCQRGSCRRPMRCNCAGIRGCGCNQHCPCKFRRHQAMGESSSDNPQEDEEDEGELVELDGTSDIKSGDGDDADSTGATSDTKSDDGNTTRGAEDASGTKSNAGVKATDVATQEHRGDETEEILNTES
ncbi:hypothetical protein BD779DRAFT_1541953 [Infundibulicybe gibba]|nr:hypothetical protein BD779DRAFT_1541953 [Infundibulicybe gibba]